MTRTIDTYPSEEARSSDAQESLSAADQLKDALNSVDQGFLPATHLMAELNDHLEEFLRLIASNQAKSENSSGPIIACAVPAFYQIRNWKTWDITPYKFLAYVGIFDDNHASSSRFKNVFSAQSAIDDSLNNHLTKTVIDTVKEKGKQGRQIFRVTLRKDEELGDREAEFTHDKDLNMWVCEVSEAFHNSLCGHFDGIGTGEWSGTTLQLMTGLERNAGYLASQKEVIDSARQDIESLLKKIDVKGDESDQDPVAQEIRGPLLAHSLYVTKAYDLVYIFSNTIRHEGKKWNDGGDSGLGGLFLLIKKELVKQKNDFGPILIMLSHLTDKLSTRIVNHYQFRAILNHAQRAAVTAIMSRNGSHNIGSHVLSSVAQNLSVLADDQMLFTYIQQRMDFIAQISTEIPQWSYSCMVYQDLLRRFLMQRNLLNYICESEGLSAYEYRGATIQNGEREKTDFDKSSGKIVFRLRKKTCDGEEQEYLISPDPKDKKVSLPEVVNVAIPGGVVGQHAFFTILENILRNSAKHNWAQESEDKKKSENLEITIEYDDTPPDYVTFKIWDNISDVFPGDDFKHLDYAMKKDIAGQLTSNGGACQPLHFKINEKLKKNFIDSSSGRLLYEDWGLAEMKICTGFLNRKSATEFLKSDNVLFRLENHNYVGFLAAEGVEDDTRKGMYHLGYKFRIPKPKELLVVGSGASFAKARVDDEQQKDAMNHGVYFKEKPESYDYEMVAFTDGSQLKYGEVMEEERYPCRLILVDTHQGNGPRQDIENLRKVRRLVIIKEEQDIISLQDLIEQGKWDELKLKLHAHWLASYFNLPNNKDKDALSILLQTEVPRAEAAEGSPGSGDLDRFVAPYGFTKDDIRKITPIFEKYDEDIETLPTEYRADGVKGRGQGGETPNSEKLAESYNKFLNPCVSKLVKFTHDERSAKIMMCRHIQVAEKNGVRYQESLSGSQTYFKTLDFKGLDLNGKDADYRFNRMSLNLLENALLRVRIIDERVAKYHFGLPQDLRERFYQAGLFPTYGFDYKESTDKKDKKDEKDKILISGTNLTEDEFEEDERPRLYIDLRGGSQLDFDVLVVHQTILDEIFTGNNPRKQSETFIEGLKERGAIVVVTSGRGRPDKIPHNAKFLPFSNLETFVMKQYHEKFLLTQLLMDLTSSSEGENG